MSEKPAAFPSDSARGRLGGYAIAVAFFVAVILAEVALIVRLILSASVEFS